jgi:hypothetical protein
LELYREYEIDLINDEHWINVRRQRRMRASVILMNV